ncbi:MAG: hypothetical protein DRO01_07595 [Thermoproteota archaeon]|nr:MAG: hypothetical protein DRO01_07595 [Candidatus Korarchaeota archaeon]
MLENKTIQKRASNTANVTKTSNQKKNFYVYEYINLKTKIPFYIGKGKDYRFSSHLNEARNTDTKNPKLDMIRNLNFEEGVQINIVQDQLDESHALALETNLIKQLGRKDLGKGPLLNRSNGGEGLSGGVDQYGYKRKGIARFVTDLVHNGEYIQNMPRLVQEYVLQNDMKVKWVEERIIPHIQEMGNVGCHYKGPKFLLQGWQFSLDGKMIDVNSLTLDTLGLLKVHGDLPFNQGYISTKV